ncbi:hypothetical protein V1521DRAFT_440385 [Lipomyces starkeyi]
MDASAELYFPTQTLISFRHNPRPTLFALVSTLKMAENAQAITALSLLRSGVSLQLFGLVWGLIIPVTPFPKLALTAHIQSMAQGCSCRWSNGCRAVERADHDVNTLCCWVWHYRGFCGSGAGTV